MNRNALTTVVAVVCSFAVGLGWSWFQSSRAAGVAVVDLDEVARRLGRDNQMTESFQNESGRLNRALQQVQQDAVAKLEDIRKGLGETPTEDQAKEFNRIKINAQLQLNQLKQRAELQLNQHRQQLVGRFREDAKPIAAKVAHQRGFSTVVTRNDSVVFSYDDAVDITEDVIALMSAEMPARPVARPASAASSPAPSQAAQPSATPAPPAPAQTSQRAAPEGQTR